jgi:hypothetical protein
VPENAELGLTDRLSVCDDPALSVCENSEAVLSAWGNSEVALRVCEDAGLAHRLIVREESDASERPSVGEECGLLFGVVVGEDIIVC